MVFSSVVILASSLYILYRNFLFRDRLNEKSGMFVSSRSRRIVDVRMGKSSSMRNPSVALFLEH